MRPLVALDILGLPCVPWSVPDIGVARGGGKPVRFAKQDKRLVEWQAYVKAEATKAMARTGITLGPIYVNLTFFKKTPDGHRHGELWLVDVEWSEEKEKYVKKGKSSPDLINLFKGTEDALEGVIYANDVQTCVIQSLRIYGPLDGVAVRVSAIEPGDFPGRGDPVGKGQNDPEGETPAPVRVRRSADRPPGQRGGGKRKPRRADQVSLAVPGEGGDEVREDPPAA